jgi:hypothetical protein
VIAVPSWFAFSDALASQMASDANLPGYLRVLLLACTNMSRVGLATFRPGQLAERLTLSQRSVDRSLAELRQRGLIDPGSNSERIMVHWSYAGRNRAAYRPDVDTVAEAQARRVAVREQLVAGRTTTEAERDRAAEVLDRWFPPTEEHRTSERGDGHRPSLTQQCGQWSAHV